MLTKEMEATDELLVELLQDNDPSADVIMGDLTFLEEDEYIELLHDLPLYDEVDKRLLFSGTKQCPHCRKEVRQLRKHLLVHTNLKPYKCTLCSYSATQKSNLNRHVRCKHEDSSFKCNLCEKCFKRPDKLKSHKKSMH